MVQMGRYHSPSLPIGGRHQEKSKQMKVANTVRGREELCYCVHITYLLQKERIYYLLVLHMPIMRNVFAPFILHLT